MMSNSIVITNRLNWIDWAKTFAILFVVFGHIPEPRGSFCINYIVQFHMPLFFFISGYLTKKEFLCRDTLMKYWHSLIIPYICFNLIYIPYWYIRHIIDYPNAELFDYVKPLIGILFLQLETPISESLNGVTWFIADLLIMKIILSFCNKYKYGAFFMTVFCFIVTMLYIFNEHYRFYIDLPFVGFVRCLPFFYLGYLCRFKKLISERPQRNDFYFFVTGITIGILTYSIERVTSGIFTYGVCFWIICITSIYGILCLCKLLDKFYYPIIDNISIGTIVIMGLHWILISTTNFTLQKILHIPQIVYSLPVAIMLTLLFTALLYPIILLLRDKCPFMLGKRTVANNNRIIPKKLSGK